MKAVCRSFGETNRRKALLVMATGSGKTRTVIELCRILLPDLSCSNMCDNNRDENARCIFSTYQTMMNLIDDTRDEAGKIFSCGHFDLVICDEAHRSIYQKYRDIFTYFDALLIGLTATPKDDIDKNTYSVFELESGVPTYGYELAQAVKDGYLVEFQSIETTLKLFHRCRLILYYCNAPLVNRLLERHPW